MKRNKKRKRSSGKKEKKKRKEKRALKKKKKKGGRVKEKVGKFCGYVNIWENIKRCYKPNKCR